MLTRFERPRLYRGFQKCQSKENQCTQIIRCFCSKIQGDLCVVTNLSVRDWWRFGANVFSQEQKSM